MVLYGGVWYAEWSEEEDGCPCAADAHRGLVVSAFVLDELCASASGAPVTWEHSALPAVSAASSGNERQAALAHGQVAGVVKAAWVCGATGHAHVVFEIPDAMPMVCALVDSKILGHLSATHVVGKSEIIEMSLTASPARPGCNIAGRVPSISEYIAEHPPLTKAEHV